MIFFSTFQQINVMSTTQHMQNKAGTRVGLAVDEGKLNLKGGKHTWTKIPIVDESDETNSIDSWEESDDEEEHVPGGGTPFQDAYEVEQLEELRKEQAAKEAKLLEQKQKAEANRQKQLRKTSTPTQNKDELDFGSYGYIQSLFGFNFNKQMSKCSFYKTAAVTEQKHLTDLLTNIRDMYFDVCDNLKSKLDELVYTGGGEGDMALENDYISKANKAFKTQLDTMLQSTSQQNLLIRWNQSIIEFIEHGEVDNSYPDGPFNGQEETKPQVVNERTQAFNLLEQQKQIDPSLLTCTRVCNEFKTGQKCTHPKCTFAHSFDQLKPKTCVFGELCNKQHNRANPCECAHPVDGVLETKEQVVARLNLVKPLPEFIAPNSTVCKPCKPTQPNKSSTLVPAQVSKANRQKDYASEKTKIVERLAQMELRSQQRQQQPHTQQQMTPPVQQPMQPFQQQMTPPVQQAMQSFQQQPQTQQMAQPVQQQPTWNYQLFGQQPPMQHTMSKSMQQALFRQDPAIMNTPQPVPQPFQQGFQQPLKDPAIMNTPKPMVQATQQMTRQNIECSPQQAIQFIQMMQQSGMDSSGFNFKIV